MIGCFFFFFLQYTGIEMVNILKSTLSIPVQIFSKNPPPRGADTHDHEIVLTSLST